MQYYVRYWRIDTHSTVSSWCCQQQPCFVSMIVCDKIQFLSNSGGWTNKYIAPEGSHVKYHCKLVVMCHCCFCLLCLLPGLTLVFLFQGRSHVRHCGTEGHHQETQLSEVWRWQFYKVRGCVWFWSKHVSPFTWTGWKLCQLFMTT